jgi:hypothetical protein
MPQENLPISKHKEHDAAVIASNGCVSKFIDSVIQTANWSNIVDCGGYNPKSKIK